MEQRIELAPNCSLKPAGALLFFGSTCLFSLAFALVFVFHGFWPVLPFWALEMLALGLALQASLRRGKCTQTVLITDSQISLVTQFAAWQRRNRGLRGIGRRLDFAVRRGALAPAD